MALTLTILASPDPQAPRSRDVRQGTFSLGRASDNDWVLADPERHLSKRHCVLVERDGFWELTDLSTNGTFLNDEPDPIGTGNLRDLRDGDRLRLGGYEIALRIAEAPHSSPPVSLEFDESSGTGSFGPRLTSDPVQPDHTPG